MIIGTFHDKLVLFQTGGHLNVSRYGLGLYWNAAGQEFHPLYPTIYFDSAIIPEPKYFKQLKPEKSGGISDTFTGIKPISANKTTLLAKIGQVAKRLILPKCIVKKEME